MATPAEKLAEALEVLKALQQDGKIAIHSGDISRTYRERLVQSGFLKEVIKGWYIPVRPDEKEGDSTSWYNSYWDFIAVYLNERYGNEWYVSAEQSLILNTGIWTVPKQLVVRSPKGTNYKTDLAFDTSIFHIKSEMPKAELLKKENGIWMYTTPAALVYCSPATFNLSPIDANVALGMIRDSSEILTPLLDGGHSTVAGRLAGAFRAAGRDRIADEIIETMKTATYDVRESNPFEKPVALKFGRGMSSPYVNRIKLMWNKMRQDVIAGFPVAPGISKDHITYMKSVEDIYVTDAYHSLSIEKYRVTPELIEKVRSGTWDTINNEEDKKNKDAMAARGYYQAFQKVKESIEQILNGKNPGDVVDKDHGPWYRELFGPSITAGILKASDLAGYRNHPVYIGGSKHVPLNVDAVRDAMPTLFELLAEEPEASVRAVLGHFIFVFIHPYMDGNGRMGRFMMNAMLSSGGYPWTVIPVEERTQYMRALESASVEQDIVPFTRFLGHLVQKAMEGQQVATV